MAILITREWDELLVSEYNKPYFYNLLVKLKSEYAEQTVYPPPRDVFNAFRLTEPSEIKTVILGQDPYHGAGQAHGLCFSVREGAAPPPSLKNIFKEIYACTGVENARVQGYDLTGGEILRYENGDLTNWAKNGVFLLNTVLTVREGKPNSHKKLGWTEFTDAVIAKINTLTQPIVFMFWGNSAISKAELITNPAHLVLTAPHPSPLSAYHGFFGCEHFSKANAFLVENDLPAIDWQIN